MAEKEIQRDQWIPLSLKIKWILADRLVIFVNACGLEKQLFRLSRLRFLYPSLETTEVPINIGFNPRRSKISKQIPSWFWVIITIASIPILGIVDWQTGYELNFFVFYFAPILVGAWFLGFGYSIFLSVLCALVWSGADSLSGHAYSSHVYAVWNTIIRLVSYLLIGGSVSSMRQVLKREHDTAENLRRSLSEIKVLETFLPICSQCKKIRNKQGVWQKLEDYIGEHSNTRFSHGYCPECARKAMEEAGLIKKKTKP